MGFEALPVLGVNEPPRQALVSQEILGSVAGVAPPGWSDVDDALPGFEPVLPALREVHHQPEALLALLECRRGFDFVCDVVGHRDASVMSHK